MSGVEETHRQRLGSGRDEQHRSSKRRQETSLIREAEAIAVQLAGKSVGAWSQFNSSGWCTSWRPAAIGQVDLCHERKRRGREGGGEEREKEREIKNCKG